MTRTTITHARRLALLTLLLSSPVAAQTAAPPITAAARAQIDGLLSAYEPADPHKVLSRIGAPAADVLLAVAVDRAAPPLRRLRAIEALGHVPTAAGLSFLRELVQRQRRATESLAVFEVAAAARALGGFGPATEPDLLGLSDHPSADVREGCVAGLARLGTPPALRALRGRLVVERERGVRALLSARLAPATSRPR